MPLVSYYSDQISEPRVRTCKTNRWKKTKKASHYCRII